MYILLLLFWLCLWLTSSEYTYIHSTGLALTSSNISTSNGMGGWPKTVAVVTQTENGDRCSVGIGFYLYLPNSRVDRVKVSGYHCKGTFLSLLQYFDCKLSDHYQLLLYFGQNLVINSNESQICKIDIVAHICLINCPVFLFVKKEIVLWINSIEQKRIGNLH